MMNPKIMEDGILFQEDPVERLQYLLHEVCAALRKINMTGCLLKGTARGLFNREYLAKPVSDLEKFIHIRRQQQPFCREIYDDLLYSLKKIKLLYVNEVDFPEIGNSTYFTLKNELNAWANNYFEKYAV